MGKIKDKYKEEVPEMLTGNVWQHWFALVPLIRDIV
jgi:hypothetical protein